MVTTDLHRADAARWSTAVAAILGPTGVPCGAGFLAEGSLVVTCAHVITAAGAGPGGLVELAFPHLPSSPRFKVRVDPELWRAADDQDVAMLRLDQIPHGVRALRLGSAAGCHDHRVSVFGFPDGAPEGRFGYATAGDELARAVLQLRDANDLTVGFSGGPVLDQTTGLVIGMVTEILDPDQYRRGAEVAFATTARVLRQVHPGLPEEGVCPYRGLKAYGAEHSAWFHGRGEAANRVVGALGRRAVLLLGPSGSGKSSLVHAGVLPALARGEERPGAELWRVVKARPARDLLAALDDAGLHGARTSGLVHAVRRNVAELTVAGSRLLLVIDQFEELFTEHVHGRAATFTSILLAELCTVVQEATALTVVLVMRDDFYPQLAATAPQLLELLAPGTVNIPAALTRIELEQIITRPAADVGLILEDGLAEQIVADLAAADERARDGQVPVTVLPLLQLALLQLWEKRDGSRLTFDAYRRMGRVTGSLTSRCDQVVEELPAAQQPIARRMLTALVRPGDPARNVPAVRRQRPVSDLRELSIGQLCAAGAGFAEVDAVLRALSTTTPLIVTHTPDGAEPVAELVHDALIRDWATLRGWVAQDAQFHDWLLRAQQRQERHAASRVRADLLGGSDLSEGLGWARQRRLPTPIEAYLTASRSAEQDRVRRHRIAVAVMAVLLVLGLTAAGTAVAQRRSAVQAEHAALSRQLAAQSQIQVTGNPDLSALLAVHAHRVSATPEAVAALFGAASAIRPLRHTLLGHTGPVWSAAYSRDGQLLATGGGDATVRLWDLATGTGRAVTVTEGRPVLAVAFSPDGSTIAAATGEDTVRLWNTTTGRQTAAFSGQRGVRSVAFSPDGRTLATGSGEGDVRLWNTRTGTAGATLTGHTDAVKSLAFSPDGATLASGSGDTTVRLWRVEDGTNRAVLAQHRRAVNAVAFSPDSRTLATVSDDHTGRLWRVGGSAASLATLVAHTDTVNAVAFSRDGRTVATASNDNTVRLWDTATATSKATLVRHSFAVNAVAFSPDGTTLATGGSDATVRLWDAATGPNRTILTGHGDVWAVDFSRDGMLATAGGDNTARLWDATTGTARGVLTGHTDSVLTVAFSPDGRTLATGGDDHSVRLWDVAGRRQLVALTAAAGIRSVAFSPDGRTLAAAGNDAKVRLWSLPSRKGKAVLTGHTEAVTSLAFAPDGRTLATASDDHTVRLWDTATGTLTATLRAHTDVVTSVAYSPDGTTLATASTDHTVRLWNAVTHASRVPLPVDGYAVNAVTFSPDGRVLATVSDNRTARLWDVATGTARGVLTGHTDTVHAVAFTPDGRMLATGSGDQTARTWDYTLPDPDGAIAQICSALGHEIVPGEYALYLPGRPVEPACP